MKKQIVETSKFLSLVLRHQPEAIDLTLDGEGWASVADLLKKAGEHGHPVSPELLREIVATSDKQRFCLNSDGSRIRANQGHSVRVELGLKPLEPPELLFHGTATRFLESILRDGLHAANRHHVHLSLDQETAREVGKRHGKPVILQVASGAMFHQKHRFFLSENGVWLTESVPPAFLTVLENR